MDRICERMKPCSFDSKLICYRKSSRQKYSLKEGLGNLIMEDDKRLHQKYVGSNLITWYSIFYKSWSDWWNTLQNSPNTAVKGPGSSLKGIRCSRYLQGIVDQVKEQYLKLSTADFCSLYPYESSTLYRHCKLWCGFPYHHNFAHRIVRH